MLAPNTAKSNRNWRSFTSRVRFPNIVRDAEILGVHRVYLYLVLSGKAKSHRLTAKYSALKEQSVTE
jgi:hypothetical protein